MSKWVRNRAYDSVDAKFITWDTPTADTLGDSYPGSGDWETEVSGHVIEGFIDGPTVQALLAANNELTVDASLGETIYHKLVDDVTIRAPVNPTSGQTLTFILYQQEQSSFTVTWNAIYHVSAPWNNVTAEKTTVISFIYYYDGYWHQKNAAAEDSPYVPEM